MLAGLSSLHAIFAEQTARSGIIQKHCKAIQKASSTATHLGSWHEPHAQSRLWSGIEQDHRALNASSTLLPHDDARPWELGKATNPRKMLQKMGSWQSAPSDEARLCMAMAGLFRLSCEM